MNENIQNNSQNINNTSQNNVNQNNINSNHYTNNLQSNANTQNNINTQANVNHVQPSMNTQANVNHVQPSMSTQTGVNQAQPSMNTQANVSHVQPSMNTQANVSHVQPSMSTQTGVSQVQPNNNNDNQSKNTEQKKEFDLEIVDPLNPDNVTKTEKLIEKQESTEEEIETDEPVDNTSKKKKNIKKFIPIIILSLIIVIALIVLIILNIKSDTPVNPNPIPPTPEVPDIEPITFDTIVNNFNNNDLLNDLKGDGTIEATIADNKLNITVSPSVNSDSLPVIYEFNLNNRNIEISLDDNNTKGLQLFMILCDSIGKHYNLNNHEVYNYLSSIDLKTTPVDGITVTENNNEFLYSVNIDKKINTSALNNMYIEKTDLEEYRDFIENSGSTRLTKGNLMLYKEGDNKTATIIIAEKGQLSNLTYQSILSVVDLLFEEELDNFKTSYPALETISFDRYNITIDPELTGTIKTLFEQYQNEYQFIEIKITL